MKNRPPERWDEDGMSTIASGNLGPSIQELAVIDTGNDWPLSHPAANKGSLDDSFRKVASE
jgi:hypothetical protein